MYQSSYPHMNNTNNDGKSKEWTWDENKIFETILFEYLEEVQEGRWENLALVCGRSSTEVKEHYEALLHDLALIEEGLVDFPTDTDDFISKGNASIDEKKDPPTKNKTKKVVKHWSEEEHRYIYTYLQQKNNLHFIFNFIFFFFMWMSLYAWCDFCKKRN